MEYSERVVAHAGRVASLLDEFIGLLFATRTTAALWNVLGRRHPTARAHAWMMSEGAILITMRRFDDLWRHHVQDLLEPSDLGFDAGAWLAREIAERNIRTTASRMVAHYAAEKSDAPLTVEDVEALMRSNGWLTDYDVRVWAGEAMWKIAAVWAGLRAKYTLSGSEPKEWMVAALDDAQWVIDTIAERYGLRKESP